ncbi:DUF862-domain-containing protein [Crucibulum laeve]|uniref:DUF862-domain-containing protein n=1 Tax=Crucibulum laeve TaxID=68775 RepID=A0A5C3M688_9AGAR|nr:DUF862-domain-containing protein [Crucibulum laeve]
MTSQVKLYVYDLSNGMARQMSRQLTGRQIDGIWHTSVVVYGKEIFYGQGINITLPGRSHHGSPLQVEDMGETSIDEETFNEYLSEMREHYTADKYHLLEFNCNSFTNDCIGFLTGGSIPSYIKDLPTDFLSTPFGAALRPTIDAMYRRPSPGAAPIPAATAAAANVSPNPQLASSILQSIATQAQAGGFHPSPNGNAQSPPPLQATQTLTAPINIITNPASFRSFLGGHRAAVAFFTSATCPPCRMIEPIFERLAEEKGVQGGRNGAGFAKIDLGVGMGRNVAAEYGVRATPTFISFLDGKKVEEVKGADAAGLKSMIDLVIFQAFPPHPHTALSVPAIQAVSFNPILFSQVPPIDSVLGKLSAFIDAAPWPSTQTQSQVQVKTALTSTVAPYLKARFATTPPTPLPSATPAILSTWAQATAALTLALPIESLFPLADMWRLALLDPAVGTWSAASPPSDPIALLLPKAVTALQNPSKGSRNYLLTVLRMLSNAFSSTALARRLLIGNVRGDMTSVLVPSLLHEDASVRTAAASLAFNAAAVLQKARVDAVRTGRGIQAENEVADEDWEVEVISAIMEAIDREKESEEVVHRLTASFAFLVRLSPFYDTQIQSLLDVLQSKKVLKSKLVKGDGWNADNGIAKKDIRRLVDEVAAKLCP